MTRTIAAAAAELAILHPRLQAALAKDNTGEPGQGITAAVPVNIDVLRASDTIKREVPAAVMLAADIVGERGHKGEPWRPRTYAACWIAIPRFAARMWNMSKPVQAQYLEDATFGWLRETKSALGFIKRPLRLPRSCPAADHDGPPTCLVAAGPEGFLRADGTIEWVAQWRVFCPWCCAVWERAEFDHLGLVLEAS